MMPLTTAFLSPVPLATGARYAAPLTTTSPSPAILHVLSPRHPAHIQCAMTESKDAKGSKKKKSAPPPVFATDMKGNFVWMLRAATMEDVEGVSEFVGQNLPKEMVSSFIEDSGCCMVCEASVKGTHEGEGYMSKLMGVALVDVTTELRDKKKGFSGGITKKAELLNVMASHHLPEPEVVKRKLVLGAMKKLKQNGVAMITTAVSANDLERVDAMKECLFSGSASGDLVEMSCNLATENPDPQKKIV